MPEQNEQIMQETQGFDLNQQKQAAKQEDEGTDVHIHGVDERPLYFKRGEDRLPVVIRVAGAHSSIFRRVEATLRKRKLKPNQFTSEALYDDNIEKTAACIISWDGFFAEGVPLELSPHNARMLLKHCPWVLNQLVEAMNDHARFFEQG